MSEYKTGDNFQWGITSDAAGNASLPDPPTGGFGRPPLVDNHGRPIVRIADGAGFIDGGFSTRVQGQTPGIVDQQSILAVPGSNQHIFGFNNGAAVAYLFIQDSAAVIAPLDASQIAILVPGQSQFSFSVPWQFANGIQIGLSSDPSNFAAVAQLRANWIVYS